MLRNFLRRLYVRPPEPIPREHGRLLLLVGAAMFIAGYDANIYGMAVRQIQKSFDIPDADIGRLIAIFRIGVIPALGLSYLADRIGRRFLLMATLAGAAFATVWTAFASSLPEFIAAQMLARVFIYTEEILCIVVIAEEFSERTRGWAVGQLGALAAFGAGFAALMFGFVNMLPFGWRAIYFLGAFPLLWLLWARRALPETRRFKEQAAKDTARPLLALISNYPGRLALLAGVALIYAFAMGATVTLFSPFLQTTHHWLPWQIATLLLSAGGAAVFGNTVAGTLSDRFGRRRVISISVLVSSVSFAAFYGWATGPWLALFWTTGLFAFMATDILVAALGAELFPTSHRSLAAGVRFFAWLFGGLLGLLVEAELFEKIGTHGPAIASLTIVAPLSLIFVAFLPESAGKSLDEIAAEKLT